MSLSGIITTKTSAPEADIVLVYLQGEKSPLKSVDALSHEYRTGNAGNPLHRIQVFHRLLQEVAPLSGTSASSASVPSLAIMAVAPRSFWKSTKKTPTEAGLLADYRSAVNYALQTYPKAKIVVYGHSLGGAAATCLLAQLSDNPSASSAMGQTGSNDYTRIRGLILENPFASIEGMVRALYPQRWLPYHHLAPLAFDKWDAAHAMRHPPPKSVLKRLRKHTLLLVSEKDEMVPREMGEELWLAAQQEGQPGKDDYPSTGGRMVIVKDALHENMWQKRQWAKEVKQYIVQL